MKLLLINIVALTCCMATTTLKSISIVYNLRVAEITRRQSLNPKYTDPSIITIALLEQSRKRVDCVHENIAGNLFTYLYVRKHFYWRADFAFGNVQAHRIDSTFSRTQTDDILFTCGYSTKITPRTKMTLSMLLGFPTHRDTILEGIQFGTGHNGFGLQCDGSFVCSEDGNHSILAAARYIRFFPGSAERAINNRCASFELDPGNVVDLIAGYNKRFGTQGIEVGYNASFLFSASITPALENMANQLNGIRSNFYGAYKKIFLSEGHHPYGIIIAISYGFDNKPKVFKRIFTIWTAWGINF